MLSRITTASCCILTFLASDLRAHSDRILDLKGTEIVGLPEDFLPATLDLNKGVLTIADKKLEFTPFLKGIFAAPQRYKLQITSSWYHDPDILPPYIVFKATPKGRDFTYSILVDMKKMIVMEVELELKESDSLTTLVPIDPKCWKKGENGGTIQILK